MALCTSEHEAAFIRKPPVRKHERGCVIIDYGHLWCTLLLYIV